ncbi:MAG: hypothetical protein ACOC5T_01935 [Elusimicrobiota bacterium]
MTRNTKVDVIARKGDDILVKHKKDEPNSYETGAAGNRFKLYFETASELREKVKNLQEEGFIIDEPEELV